MDRFGAVANVFGIRFGLGRSRRLGAFCCVYAWSVGKHHVSIARMSFHYILRKHWPLSYLNPSKENH
jgi:hypothetical protein